VPTEIPVQVAIFEDDKRSAQILQRLIESYGYQVAVVISTLETALETIPKLQQQGITLALIDGNLSEYDFSCQDGEIIAQKIRNQAPAIKTIGIASDRELDNVDANAPKSEGPASLRQAIKVMLTEPSQT
jgi:CheY-like chemotaxis protein